MYKITGNDLIEGICPGNCCGGMKLWDCDTERDDKCTGDFKETDTIPPLNGEGVSKTKINKW